MSDSKILETALQYFKDCGQSADISQITEYLRYVYVEHEASEDDLAKFKRHIEDIILDDRGQRPDEWRGLTVNRTNGH
jgi:hypothetical protein